jgi:subtilisin family serine protease
VSSAPADVDYSKVDPLGQVRLTPLMALSQGEPWLRVGLPDGPIDLGHPRLSRTGIHILRPASNLPMNLNSPAGRHATFVAGVLHGRRGGASPAIVPGCTLFVLPIFSSDATALTFVKPGLLADALIELISAGVQVINISAVLMNASAADNSLLKSALDHAASRGVLVVTAAGNRSMLTGTALTRHPWVIPVAASGPMGAATRYSDLSRSVALRGVRAPGEDITSLAPGGGTTAIVGTSVAASIVTGAIALAWSLNPDKDPATVRAAFAGTDISRRHTLIPPLLDAWGAHLTLNGHKAGGTL